MENKFESKKAPATQPKEDHVVAVVKKTRAVPVSFGDKVKVLKLVGDGKGTVEDLVATGIAERTAKIALKTLLKEKIIKQSFVVTA